MNLPLDPEKYLNTCRNMLIGKTIRGVVYAQYSLGEEDFEDEGEPTLVFETDHPDLHALESSFYLMTDDMAYRFSWIESSLDTGLEILEIHPSSVKNEDEFQWEVSGENQWKPIMGQKITDLSIIWDNSWSRNLLSPEPYDIHFPRTYVLKTDNQKTLILSAGIYDDGDCKPFIDNLFITTHTEVALKKLPIKQADLQPF